MGIHGNATAQIVLDGAVGTLVGEPNKGLAAMFVMMNAARLGVGIPVAGPDRGGLPERRWPTPRTACRCARCPARRRTDKPADPIIVHPDVRKMLLTARAYAEGGRALAMYTTLLLDKELATADEEVRKDCADLVALLTPIVKAFLTDNGLDRDLALHAGLRRPRLHQANGAWSSSCATARINMIYEGTNTIQSLDLLGRKVLGDNGAKLKKFGKLIARVRRGGRRRTRRCRSSSTRWPTSATRSPSSPPRSA